jgi:nucleotide-binding universal stress UspA family protein
VTHSTRQILIATDFSDSAEAAFDVAVDYARVLHARLHLLHVFAASEVEVTGLLADAAANAGPDVPVTVAGAGGDPADVILEYAARHPIDLIVVGSHGRTGMSRALLGSVAERVVRGARCPVLVVPSGRSAAAPVPSGVTAGREEREPFTATCPCVACARPTRDLICEACRARIRGEPFEHRHRGAPGDTMTSHMAGR